jgi:cell division protein FtsI/penicillin-binding protein 2
MKEFKKSRTGFFESCARALLVIAFVVLAVSITACGGDTSDVYDEEIATAAREALSGIDGVVVVMDMKTGRILAMEGGAKDESETLSALDLAARRAFPPGSLVKLVTAWKALEDGAVSGEETFFCDGKTLGPHSSVSCWDPRGHGNLDLVRAIAVSCNLYFGHMGDILGADGTYRGLLELGFSDKTGIPVGSEVSGRVNAPPDGLDPEYAAGDGPWVTATPLQVLTGIGGLVNGGVLLTPYESGPDDADEFIPPRRRVSVTVSRDIIREGMRGAVEYGTAKKAAIDGMEILGKTGTGGFLDGSGLTHGWFVGFAPAGDPRIGVVVFVYRGYGGEDAAPVAREIFSVYHRVGSQE